MIFGYLTLITALIISLSSAVYSILGLTAIFAAAFWPIVVLGGSLEIGKIISTLWLHKYWDKAELQYKVYLSSAVAILMVLTSMGVFGFLSKAHLDQAVPSGDVQAQVQIFDDKIQTQKDNIKTARAALAQMDTAVDQVMGRSSDEKGADKAVAIRRSQAKERGNLQNDISKAQAEITKLQEQRAPIASEARKVEAEVGPIKYIAALIYGDNPDANILEKSVRWVIILIVIVFDPLALTLLLAATKTFEWERGINILAPGKKEEDNKELKEEESVESWFTRAKGRARFWDKQQKPITNDAIDESQFWIRNVEDSEPVVDQPTDISPEDYYRAMGLFDEYTESKKIINDEEPNTDPFMEDLVMAKDPTSPGWMFASPTKLSAPVEQLVEEEIIVEEPTDIEPYGSDMEKHVMRMWKSQNPDKTYKQYLDDLRNSVITELPWKHIDHVEGLGLSDRDLLNLKELHLQADNEPTVGEVQGFGIEFPKTAKKGDMFLRVDNLPSQLYKYNGIQWIKVNKNLSDSYIYDDAYIDHLIEKIGSGEYDPDLLSDIERERIAEKLKNSTDLG
jgi:hypothetical protein